MSVINKKIGQSSNKHILFLIFTISIVILYIYHNSAPLLALWVNGYAFFLVFKPYTWYSHLPEFISITFLWLLGYALGAMLLRILNQKVRQSFELCIPLGWGVLSLIIFALALLQLLNSAAIAICLVVLALLAISWMIISKDLSLTKPIEYKKRFFSLQWDARVAAILILIPLSFAFFCSLMPPTQSDGLRYHLSVPKLYLDHGGFYLIPDIAFSNFPFLIEYLFAIPLAFGLNSVPKMIHASFYIFIIKLIYNLGKKTGGERVGIFGALLFASVPFTSIFASWSFIEMGLTFYTLLACALCFDIVESIRLEEKRFYFNSILLMGITGGFLIGCKYTALTTVFLIFMILLCSTKSKSFKEMRTNLLRAVLFGGVTALVASPWLIKNAILLGNPVYPFAGGLFAHPYWSDFNNLFFHFHAGGKGSFNELLEAPWWEWITDAVTLPFRVTFFPGDKEWHTERFGSWQLGPMWLILAPFIPLHRNWTVRKSLHLITGLFLYFIWAYTYRDSRFLLPAMAITAPLFAVLVEELISLRSWCKWCFFSGISYCLLFTSTVILLPEVNAPWWVISGAISEEQYLEKYCIYTRLPNQAFRWLRENTDPSEKVLLHGIEHPFYCPNEFVGADWFNTDPLIRWSWETPDAKGLIERLRQENIKYLVYYYGKIKNPEHFPLYCFFRLPQEKGIKLLSEYKKRQYSKERYPYAYKAWATQFERDFAEAERSSPNVKALETLLDGGLLAEVFKYQDPKNQYNGISILKIQ